MHFSQCLQGSLQVLQVQTPKEGGPSVRMQVPRCFRERGTIEAIAASGGPVREGWLDQAVVNGLAG